MLLYVSTSVYCFSDVQMILSSTRQALGKFCLCYVYGRISVKPGSILKYASMTVKIGSILQCASKILVALTAKFCHVLEHLQPHLAIFRSTENKGLINTT